MQVGGITIFSKFSCCLRQNQLLTDKLNATLLLELNGLRRYYATNRPAPDTLDDIASQILPVLEATATVDQQADIDYTAWSQHSLIAQEISYYRFVHFHDWSNMMYCRYKCVFAISV